MLINRTILPIIKQNIEEYPITLITGARQMLKWEKPRGPLTRTSKKG